MKIRPYKDRPTAINNGLIYIGRPDCSTDYLLCKPPENVGGKRRRSLSFACRECSSESKYPALYSRIALLMQFRVLFTSAVLSAAWLFAQQPSTGPKAATEDKPLTPTFKSRSQLVLVPVIVSDKNGKHLAGLTKDQFRIEEDGKARDIALFEDVLPGEPSAPEAKPAPGTTANFLGPRGVPSTSPSCVLHMINTPYLKQAEGRRQLIDFLANGLSPDEPVTLLGLTDKASPNSTASPQIPGC